MPDTFKAVLVPHRRGLAWLVLAPLSIGGGAATAYGVLSLLASHDASLFLGLLTTALVFLFTAGAIQGLITVLVNAFPVIGLLAALPTAALIVLGAYTAGGGTGIAIGIIGGILLLIGTVDLYRDAALDI